MQLPELYVVTDTFAGVLALKAYQSKLEAEKALAFKRELHDAFRRLPSDQQPRLIVYKAASERGNG